MHAPSIRAQALALILSGLNDCEVARQMGLARTTVRDWRRPPHAPRPAGTCPRCWRATRVIAFTGEDYAELLGLYLGDGYVVRAGRTYRLRIYLDSRHARVVAEARSLLERSFSQNEIGVMRSHGGAMTILSVYSSHLTCLFPQHGIGKKHERPITLEPWQTELTATFPWAFLRGLIRSDGCVFVNRTGVYEYVSYEFTNFSHDIRDLFTAACDGVGVSYRCNGNRIRICQRPSVEALLRQVGRKE